MASALFFFNDTATTEIYTLSLHDALPISLRRRGLAVPTSRLRLCAKRPSWLQRSEEHTSELQSQSNLVCRLLLEKKKRIKGPYLITLDSLISQTLDQSPSALLPDRNVPHT